MAREFSKAFYNSKEWRVVREYILKRDNYLCQHCGNPAQEVHHKVHLTPENIDDIRISLNADNLVSLCKDCHFKEHYKDKGDGHRKSDKDAVLQEYTFDENGQISPLLK